MGMRLIPPEPIAPSDERQDGSGLVLSEVLAKPTRAEVADELPHWTLFAANWTCCPSKQPPPTRVAVTALKPLQTEPAKCQNQRPVPTTAATGRSLPSCGDSD